MSRVCNGEPGLVNVQVEDPGTFDKATRGFIMLRSH